MAETRSWHLQLVVAGLLLILAGFVFAQLFAWYAGHEPRLVAHDAYEAVFEEIARGGEWHAIEAAISSNSVSQRRAADVHGHSINMGILLILVGLFAPLVGVAGKQNRWFLALTVAAVVYPAGLFLQFLGLGIAGEVVSAIGAVGAIGALAVLLVRIARAIDAI